MQNRVRQMVVAYETRLSSARLIVYAINIWIVIRQPYTFLKLSLSRAPDHMNLTELKTAEMEFTVVRYLSSLRAGTDSPKALYVFIT